MARNYANEIQEEDDIELFDKIAHSTKRKYNKTRDNREQIKQKRRQSRKNKESALEEKRSWDG